jgi:hypothetical protein
MKMETDPVSETLCSVLFRILNIGRCKKTLITKWNVFTLSVKISIIAQVDMHVGTPVELALQLGFFSVYTNHTCEKPLRN